VDSTGLKSSAKREEELKEYGVKRLLLPLAGTKTEKDVSDYFMLGNSREDLIKLFLDYLETLYSETMSALKSCEVDFNNPPPIAQMIVSVNAVTALARHCSGGLPSATVQQYGKKHYQAYR